MLISAKPQLLAAKVAALESLELGHSLRLNTESRLN